MSLLDWYRFYHARVAFWKSQAAPDANARMMAAKDANHRFPFTER